MSDKLPGEIIRFDLAVVEYGKKKLCQCQAPHYEVDCQNRLVKCLDCGAIVDAFEALVSICEQKRRVDDYRQQSLEERRAIDNYKPRRVVIKQLERLYEGKSNLVPTCPHCREAFDLKELLSVMWVNREFYKTKEVSP